MESEDRGMDDVISGGPCQIKEPGSLISIIINLDLLDIPWVLRAVLNDFILQDLKSSFCLFSSHLRYNNIGQSFCKVSLFCIIIYYKPYLKN